MEQIKRILSSRATTIVLLIVYAAGLASATFIEKAHGSMLAKALIYYSPVFFLLQFLLAANFVLTFIKYRSHKAGKQGFIAIHFAFVIILLGALISHLTGIEGMLHLREGERSDAIAAQTDHGRQIHRLPFDVELVKFTLKRYPGSMSPSSYESELLVRVDGETRRERVYMNHVLDVKGYRFFQASYDPDEKGTILSVNKDVAGRNVTYAGYILLLLGGIRCLTEKNGRIRTLYRRLKQPNVASGLFALLLLTGAPAAVAADDFAKDMRETVQRLHIAPEHAALFGSLPVRTETGRIVPVNTFSSEVLRKLHKDTRFGKMNSDQFLLSVLAYPEMWMHVPALETPDKNFARYFGLPHGRRAFIEFFEPDGSYKLQEALEAAYRKMPGKRTAFDKDVIKVDEKINILNQLMNRQLIRLFPKPDDPAQRWYAPGDELTGFTAGDSAHIPALFAGYMTEVRAAVKSQNWDKAGEALERIASRQYDNGKAAGWTPEAMALEIRYNRMDVFRWCKIGYLTFGGLLFLFSLAWIDKEKRRRQLAWIIRVLGIIVLILFHYQMRGRG
jgi:hypothetical protein